MKKIYMNGKHSDKFVIVDDEDFEFLNQFKWYYDRNGYAVGTLKGDRVAMHTVIMNYEVGIDHVNHNKLDNRKENLRQSTRSQNGYNRKPPNNRKYKGVSWHKTHKKYFARITVNGKSMHIGSFTSDIEAAKAYNDYALRYHGEFAYLNVIEED